MCDGYQFGKISITLKQCMLKRGFLARFLLKFQGVVVNQC